MNKEPITRSNERQRCSISMVFDRRGVCLTELMVSLTAGAIVLAAALHALNVAQVHVGSGMQALSTAIVKMMPP